MPFAIRCPRCQSVIKASDKAAGRTVSCPGCQTPLTFPATPPANPLTPIPPAPHPPPKPAPAPASTISPAIKPIVPVMAPIPTTPAPPSAMTAAVQKAPPPPAETDVLPNLDRVLIPPWKPPVPNNLEPGETRSGKDTDIFDDFEIIEDDVDHLAIDQLDEVLPVGDDEVDMLEEVPEPELDVLEEVVERPRPARRSGQGGSELLALRRIHVRGQKLSLGEAMVGLNEAVHDLVDPDSRRRVAVAREVRDSTTQVLRHFVESCLIAAEVEIRERGRLLARIKRAPHFHNLFGRSMIEISDARGEPLGLFDDRPWSRLMQKPMSIVDRHNRMRVQIRSQWHQGKMEFLDAAGAVIGGLSAGSGGGMRLELVRGRSCRMHFTQALDHRPEDKLCLLAAVLGLDLFDRDR